MYQTQIIPQQSMQQPGIANPGAPLPPQVPAGWAAHWDQSQQKFYFRNSMTGMVTWDYPRQNALPASPPGNLHYPPQQQQMQGFDPSATPAPQYQQQHQHPANIPVDPTAVGQPQLQHQQRQQQYGGEVYGGEEYDGEEYGGKGYGGKEYGGEECCGEGYGECAGGGGFHYGGGGFGGMLGGGGDDPATTGIPNASSYIYDPHMTSLLNAHMTSLLNADLLAHHARMTGLKNAGESIR